MASDDNVSSLNIRLSKATKTYKTLECRVCAEAFSPIGENVPRLLSCGHTLCHRCLNRLPLQNRTILCPFDRSPSVLGNSGIGGLKKNFALLELLDKLYQNQEEPPSPNNIRLESITKSSSPDSTRVRSLVDARTALVETHCKNQLREMQRQLDDAKQAIHRLKKEKQALARVCNQKLNDVLESLQLCDKVTRTMQTQFDSVQTANNLVLSNPKLQALFGSR